MKYILILIILLIAPDVIKNDEMIVFNVNGKVKLVKSDKETDKIRGVILEEADVIKVIDGKITIINRNNKRITLEKAGSYGYKNIQKLLKKAEASVSTKYFEYVWANMNDSNPSVNKQGGVIRGENYLVSPEDNSIVISDSIQFLTNNSSSDNDILFIQSEDFRVIYEDSINNALSLATKVVNEGKPGKYFWEISSSIGKIPEKRCFIIPEDSVKTNLITGFESFKNEIASYDIDTQNLLIEEYLRRNNLHYYKTNSDF